MKPASSPDLRAVFPPPTHADWTTAATSGSQPVVLDKLRTVLPEGPAIEPLLAGVDAPADPAAPGTGDRRRGPAAGPRTWLIAQALPATSPATWNAAAHEALNAGQDALLLRPAPEPGAQGLPLADAASWDHALKGIDLAVAPLLLQGPAAGAPAARALVPALLRLGGNPADAKVFFATDPLGTLAVNGSLPEPLDSAWDEVLALVEQAGVLPNCSFLAVSGIPYHQAGADAARELGLVLAAAAETFRALAARGLAPAEVPGLFRLELAAGTHLGVNIAKFRAARALWSRFATALGLQAERTNPFIHAVTAPRGRTWLDASTNTLRATNEAFSAIVGGADALSLDPWDALLRPSSDAARRLARNTQLILRDECLLGLVGDPAGGSWHFERLTEDLAAAAWSVFQQVEERGGLAAALVSGCVAEQLAKAAALEAQRLNRRRDVLVGVNQYVDTEEPVPASVPAPARICPAASAPVPPAGAVTCPPLVAARSAAGYEELRVRVAAWAASRGRPARVFLCNLGQLRQHQGRADFSRAFFEAAGLDVIYPTGFTEPAAAAAAAQEAAPDLTVICSTDDTYPEAIPAYASALSAAVPAATIIVAGAPGDREEADRKAGVSAWIHLRSDHHATLTALLEAQGLPSLEAAKS